MFQQYVAEQKLVAGLTPKVPGRFRQNCAGCAAPRQRQALTSVSAVERPEPMTLAKAAGERIIGIDTFSTAALRMDPVLIA